jgi:hypothetical protein
MKMIRRSMEGRQEMRKGTRTITMRGTKITKSLPHMMEIKIRLNNIHVEYANTQTPHVGPSCSRIASQEDEWRQRCWYGDIKVRASVYTPEYSVV